MSTSPTPKPQPPSNPYESPTAGSAVPIDPKAAARSQLYPVAIALLVPSILHIFGWLFYVVYVYSVVARPGSEPDFAHPMVVYSMYYGITMLYSLLLASGAFSMLRQGSYLWAMTICILALVPLLGPCYFAAVPAGIWGIFVLRRPAVRASFARA
jgi:hypothetical protein